MELCTEKKRKKIEVLDEFYPAPSSLARLEVGQKREEVSKKSEKKKKKKKDQRGDPWPKMKQGDGANTKAKRGAKKCRQGSVQENASPSVTKEKRGRHINRGRRLHRVRGKGGRLTLWRDQGALIKCLGVLWGAAQVVGVDWTTGRKKGSLSGKGGEKNIRSLFHTRAMGQKFVPYRP